MEQHSFTLVFELLDWKTNLPTIFEQRCMTLCQPPRKFQQLSLSSSASNKCVIATDVNDIDLKSFREDTWNKDFASECSTLTNDEVCDSEATITIEYINQARDVARTMEAMACLSRLEQENVQSKCMQQRTRQAELTRIR
jgi:hypothetical protein